MPEKTSAQNLFEEQQELQKKLASVLTNEASSKQAVEVYLKQYCAINTETTEMNQPEFYTHGQILLEIAIEKEETDAISYLVSQEGILASAMRKPLPPLEQAASLGKYKAVKALMKNETIAAHAKSPKSHALRYAAEEGYKDIVEFLQSKGANEGLAIEKARKNGHQEIVNLLSPPVEPTSKTVLL